ncbi:MAG: hypothetical protein DI537_32935 [Stutzerimonas stutzeri]|nr:MAG: hypothetical protein DI537_32935 [Stutzerimonas stutzeri]
MLAILTSTLNSYLRYRETKKVLTNLSDRELRDIGIDRWQIETAARSHR